MDHLDVGSERGDPEISDLQLGKRLGHEGERLVREMDGVGLGLAHEQKSQKINAEN